MALERFSKSAFDSADTAGKAELAVDLATALAELGRQGQTVSSLIEVLRGLGHDLWSFDEDGEGMEIWMPNYHTPTGPGIIVTFERGGVIVDWLFAASDSEEQTHER